MKATAKPDPTPLAMIEQAIILMDETPIPNEDIHLYLDNMVIARQLIGPLPQLRGS